MKDLDYYNERYPGNKVRLLTDEDIKKLQASDYNIPSNKDYCNAMFLYGYQSDFEGFPAYLYGLITNAWVYNFPIPGIYFHRLDELVKRSAEPKTDTIKDEG